ncbi:rhomboid-like protein [Streptomyces sp. NPDC020489]|uniref:rhomboid-like protein n=1 Tax=Streptomyces sp. NPDC020489 TaxID=3365077 RepID=UPI0037955BEE
MERPAQSTDALHAPSDACPPDAAGFLDAVPSQRAPGPAAAGSGPAGSALAPAESGPAPVESQPAESPPAPAESAPVPVQPVPVQPVPAPEARRRLRPWRLLPTPTGTPFTFGYAVVLAVTSLVTAYADPAVVHSLLQGSSTDVAHLVRTPVLVLVASALWMAGGVASPYALGFLLVLTALERRIGGLRAAGVFLLGHVLATLATELPVGLAVLVGHLPDSSLHRLDYGISFGVAAATGALAGLLPRWLGLPLLVLFGGMLLQSLLAFTDPMTEWGHVMALSVGIATWPTVRRWARSRAAA